MSPQSTDIYFGFDEPFDVLRSLSGSDYTICEDNASTISNSPGPGRTLGKWMSNAGVRLERFLSVAAERLGGGPNRAADDILVIADRINARGQPRNYRTRSHRCLRTPPEFASVLKDLINWYPTLIDVDVARNPKFYGCCRKLVGFLRDENIGNQYLAIVYITALLLTTPIARRIFGHLGVEGLIQETILQSSFFPNGQGLLLAPSQRALAMLSESPALLRIAEFDEAVALWQCPVDVRYKLFSDLLPYSTLPESQVLVVNRLSRIWLQYVPSMYSNAQYQLRSVFSPKLLSEWLDALFGADPLCAAVFGTSFSRLLRFPPDPDTNIDFILKISAALLWKGLDGRYASHVDFWLRQVDARFFANYKYWDALPTSKSAVKVLGKVLSQDLSNFSTTPSIIQTLRYCVSPCREIWQNFCQYWYFPGNYEFCDPRHRIALRVIPPLIQTELCHRLVDHILGTKCLARDHLRVAIQDADCHEEISRILSDLATTDKATALYGPNAVTRIHTLHSELANLSSPPSIFDEVGGNADAWCTGLYQTRDVPFSANNEDLPPIHTIAGCHDIYAVDYPDLTGEVLLARQRSLRLVPASNLWTNWDRYSPVCMGSRNEKVFIQCLAQELSAFSWDIADDFRIRDSPLTDDVYVLAVRAHDGGEAFWYNCQTRKLRHAISMETHDLPQWLSRSWCSKSRCWEWWKPMTEKTETQVLDNREREGYAKSGDGGKVKQEEKSRAWFRWVEGVVEPDREDAVYVS
ncbi:hypothetical protein JAAARDRAFT_58970 [Jaapia argillacea MUCL 33604]|uniref:Uncharacterized protein n=1 Tax=Jaapia argillacea MUCL 33604 TaxID=933084 RepID=A0A067PZK9_9AGAM|nr:hypothetical protein JAAARDRAFT_58970 [Jaapia argillacea MUCL 33604]